MKLHLLALLLPLVAAAEEAKAPSAPAPAAPPAAAAPAAPPITYELRDLKPIGFTQYQGAGEVIRQYFDFENPQGTHHVIYEEVGGAPAARSVQGLRQAAIAYDSTCSMDIECVSKAFCTGDCKSMYYETANAPGDTLAPDRNKCHLTYFNCEKTQPLRGAMPAPASLTTAAPAGTGL